MTSQSSRIIKTPRRRPAHAVLAIASVFFTASCGLGTSDTASLAPSATDTAPQADADPITPLPTNSATSSVGGHDEGPGATTGPDPAMTDLIELPNGMTIGPMVAPEDCEGTPPPLWALAEFHASHTGMTVTETRVEHARMCGLSATHFDGYTATELGITQAELNEFQVAWSAAHR